MKPYTLHLGNNLDILPTLADNSIDAIVTDPPYFISFMGKKWDKNEGHYFIATWRECLRVLKPGGHLIAFGATRTYHRLVCAIEDAGFEIRTQLDWIFGSGFPKGCDISKAINKAARVERKVIGENKFAKLNGKENKNCYGKASRPNETEAATESAKQWEGWNTQLKPAHEPICLAQKPISEKTIAANVLKWGTGGLNIGACRVPTKDNIPDHGPRSTGIVGDFANYIDNGFSPNVSGRYPATLLHDNSEAVLGMFPIGGENGKGRNGEDGKRNYFNTRKNAITKGNPEGIVENALWDEEKQDYYVLSHNGHRDGGGSAARYFNAFEHEPEDLPIGMYCPKCSPTDRNEGLPQKTNGHPTVKPTQLMQWLCRLVTPPNGTVLDPFMGSGSTGKAAMREGFNFIGIEMNAEYAEWAKARIAYECKIKQPTLF